ncbi:sigma-54-dependent transcriptional regulator [Candidatus Laterigemmans baculatus]|uniref:sigma-54-dependent transcriptional regulator n=1 Tax=Candidatus Laterigemmans baculatus TaxID=2770505 RepID=UPI0013DBE32F|nr:sigma-54 dependent transcriptional regulator [Candidatus Laterigemmans baculatus]
MEHTQLAKILVVDDDRSVHLLVQKSLADIAEVLSATTAQEGLRLVAEKSPDVVLLDIQLPDTNGLALFCQIHELDNRLPVIFITVDAGSETAIEAMQLGAYDYVGKPLRVQALVELVNRAITTRRMVSTPVAIAADETGPSSKGELFVGRSPQMLEVFKAIGRVAKQNVTVLVRGESGTGKELVARALVQYGDRSDAPFLAVNCAALPENLLESELFGHEKGAFTGAENRRIGKFEQCNGGTLLLDEIGDMSPTVQAKVLRVLQEQHFERVGGTKLLKTDVRLITATNRDLETMVEEGEFREDLLYRLNGVTINLPPLRDRVGDIPDLLHYFLKRAKIDLKKPELEGISAEATELLCAFDWPGNVRQLQAVIRRATLNTTGPAILPEALPEEIQHLEKKPKAPKTPELDHESDLSRFIDERFRSGSTNMYAETIEYVERYLLSRVLGETEGNQSQAAEILGITRGKIRDRIAAYDIQIDRKVSLS